MQVEYERTPEGTKASIDLLMATSRKETKAKFEVETRRHNKVGRNNPCPCGSGKKYKKCCLGRIEEDG